MQSNISTPVSRKDLRNYARVIRKNFGFAKAVYVDIVGFLDQLGKVADESGFDFSYEVVANRKLPKKVFATCDVLAGKIYIKERIFNNACDGDGFSRFTIAHELAHYFLIKVLGLQFAKATPKAYIPKFKDPEWQADCLAGELLMGYDMVKNYSVKKLITECGVSIKAAKCQYDKFRNYKGGKYVKYD